MLFKKGKGKKETQRRSLQAVAGFYTLFRIVRLRGGGGFKYVFYNTSGGIYIIYINIIYIYYIYMCVYKYKS